MGQKDRPIRARNRHAINPIMRKGGVHEKSSGSKRAADKQSLRAQLAKPAADRQAA